MYYKYFVQLLFIQADRQSKRHFLIFVEIDTADTMSKKSAEADSRVGKNKFVHKGWNSSEVTIDQSQAELVKGTTCSSLHFGISWDSSL